MDPQNASAQMMEKFWADWFTSLGQMQAQAAQSMGGMTAPPEAAEVEDDRTRSSGLPGAGAFPFVTPEMLRQFQGVFLQSVSKYCEEYMRSPEFLANMKHAMDNALTFRQQVNEFLDNSVSTGFRPPGGLAPDQAVIVDAVRETERKLRDQIEALSERLAKMEAGHNEEGTP